MLGRGVGGGELGVEGGSVQLLGLQSCSAQEWPLRRPGGGRGQRGEDGGGEKSREDMGE